MNIPAPTLGTDATNNAGASTWTTPAAAPFALHVHGLNVLNAGEDWREVGWKTTIEGPYGTSIFASIFAATVLASPGAHVVTQTLNGLVRSRAVVNVPADSRTSLYVDPTGGNDSNLGTLAAPFKTLDAVQKRLTDDLAIFILRGGTCPTAGFKFDQHQDIVVDAYGDAAKPLPVIYGDNTATTGDPESILSFWSTHNIMLRNVAFDSAWTVAMQGTRSYRGAHSIFGALRGDNVCLDGIELRTLNRGPDVEGVTGLLVRNINQTVPGGMDSQAVYIEGVTDCVFDGGTLIDSVNESTFRTTTSGGSPPAGGMVRALIRDVSFSRAWDTAKSRVTNRQGSHQHWLGCKTLGVFAADQPDAGGGGVTDSLYENLIITDASGVPGRMVIKPGQVGNIFRNPNVTDTIAGIDITAPAGSGNVIDGMTTSAPIGIRFNEDPTTVIKNSKVPNGVLTGSFSTGYVDGGGNVAGK